MDRNQKLSPACYSQEIIEKPIGYVVHCVGTDDPIAAFIQHSVGTQYICWPTGELHCLFSNSLQAPLHRTFHAVQSEWRGLAKTHSWKESGFYTLNFGFLGLEFYSPDYARTEQEGIYDFERPGQYTKQQLTAGAKFIKNQVKAFNIDPRNIVAHSDIEPYRYDDKGRPYILKTDPHISFPWQETQLGIWPTPTPANPTTSASTLEVRKTLTHIGYETDRCGKEQISDKGYSFELKACLVAFCRRWAIDWLDFSQSWEGAVLPYELCHRLNEVEKAHLSTVATGA